VCHVLLGRCHFQSHRLRETNLVDQIVVHIPPHVVHRFLIIQIIILDVVFAVSDKNTATANLLNHGRTKNGRFIVMHSLHSKIYPKLVIVNFGLTSTEFIANSVCVHESFFHQFFPSTLSLGIEHCVRRAIIVSIRLILLCISDLMNGGFGCVHPEVSLIFLLRPNPSSHNVVANHLYTLGNPDRNDIFIAKLGAHLVLRRQFDLNHEALGERNKYSFHRRIMEGANWCPRIEVKPTRRSCYRLTRLIFQDFVPSPHGFVAVVRVVRMQIGVVWHVHCLEQ
ncbi:hypothetical protein PENTCL1PPCAC_27161, partial [Pristionchus entomophagus]